MYAVSTCEACNQEISNMNHRVHYVSDTGVRIIDSYMCLNTCEIITIKDKETPLVTWVLESDFNIM